MLGLALALVACSPDASRGYDLRLVGTGTPEPPAACAALTNATLTSRKGTFTFTPNDGVLIIRGKVAADGSAHGSLIISSPGRQPFTLAIDGLLSRAGFEGIYATPLCRVRVSLHPPA